LDSDGLGYGSVAGSCVRDNEVSGFIKSGKFLDQVSDYKLLKTDSFPWSWLLNFFAKNL
jgi:hypothetical protein